MAQFVLIRSGASEFDEQERVQGTLDIPLSEQGQNDVRAAIAGLQPLGLEIIYAHPSEATWQTATIIAEALDIKLKKLDALQNIDQGLWQGSLWDEVKRKNPRLFERCQDKPEMICAPEGEMISEARERIETAIEKLKKKHKEDVVGIVAAEPVASLISCVVGGCELDDVWTPQRRSATWTILGKNGQPATANGSISSETLADSGSIPAPVSLKS